MITGKNILITGGAGFIGSHLVDRLIDGNDVTVYDNFSSGKKEFLSHHLEKDNFHLIKADLLEKEKAEEATRDKNIVFHLAANPDIRHGIEYTDTDLKLNTIATYNVLDGMKKNGVKNIVFSSTSAVYGQAPTPTPETYAGNPISLYGASKQACEALISAYCHVFGLQGWVFRFANIAGARLTHGVVFDLVRKLRKNQDELEILGDGEQSKSYLLANECIDAMFFAMENSKDTVNTFNLGCDDQISVKEIAELITKEMGLNPRLMFTGKPGEGGWKGDVTNMMLDTSKINKLGWKAKHNSREAMLETIRESIRQK